MGDTTWQDIFDPFGNYLWKNTAIGQDPAADAERQRKALLYQQAAAAGGFADQGQQGYSALGQQGQGALAALQRQAQGQNSVSAEQLRQSLGQQLSQQRSFAAGGPASSAAMRGRTAAIQMGRASTASAGQQALAGMAERNQAQANYANLLQGLRQQDLQAAMARQMAIQGYGAQNAGTPEKSWLEKNGAGLAAGIAAFASDRRLKTDIAPGDDKANAAIAKLQPYTYAYKDPAAYGTGQQLGTTTQDLARAGLQQAVVKTPQGEMVDAGKLSGANTAMIAALGRRVQAIEARPQAKPDDAAVAAAFGADPAARAQSMDSWARTVGMDPAQVARDAQLQAALARRVNTYKAASPEEKLGITQIWGIGQKLDDEQRARQNRTPAGGR